MAADSTELRTFMVSQECTPADSAGLIMAEAREDFPTEGTRASAVAASMAAVASMVAAAMAVADATR